MQDAAVAQAACLAAGDELHQARGIGSGAIDIDGQGDTLQPTDDVAIGGRDVPHAPRDALQHFLQREAATAIRNLDLDKPCLLGHSSELGKG